MPWTETGFLIRGNVVYNTKCEGDHRHYGVRSMAAGKLFYDVSDTVTTLPTPAGNAERPGFSAKTSLPCREK